MPEHDLVDTEHEMPEADEMDHDAYDRYISARVWFPNAQSIVESAVVKKWKCDEDFNLIGKYNPKSNPGYFVL
jgi:hypothetical protein